MGHKITGDEFYEILKRFIESKVSISKLLSMPDIYEVLSEEYNNEVLEIWEQEKDQYGQEEKDKLFSFVLHERNGEREYTYERLVVAKGIDEAEKKANKYCETWYPFDPTYQHIGHKKLHIFDSGTVYVTVASLREVDKKGWTEMMFRAALTG